MPSEPSQVITLPSFSRQLGSLDGRTQAVVMLAIIEILRVEGTELAKSMWLSPVGDGLWEFRIGKTFKAVYSKAGMEGLSGSSRSPILIRVFCAFQDELIFLIGCYDKQRLGAGKRQANAIRDAKSTWLTLKEKK